MSRLSSVGARSVPECCELLATFGEPWARVPSWRLLDPRIAVDRVAGSADALVSLALVLVLGLPQETRFKLRVDAL